MAHGHGQFPRMVLAPQHAIPEQKRHMVFCLVWIAVAAMPTCARPEVIPMVRNHYHGSLTLRLVYRSYNAADTEICV